MTEKSERPKGTFQVGDKVWVRTAESDEQYFASARLREIAADGSCNVFDEVTYKQWKVPASDVWPVNPPSMDGVEDNTSMMFLYDPNLLHNLRFRYEKDLIYTYTAYILIAINPYKRLPLYGDEIIKNYSGKSIGMLPPHVYAIGDRAYRNMKGFRRNQSIVVSGESGAGKTETCKIVMRFFAVIAATNQGEQSQDAEKDLGRLESKILEANPVLESFGNAKTLRNNNSSRFGKFTKLHFDPHAKLSGASIVTYLLEKSRVVQQAKGERNFHIFYQILSGSSSDEKKRWRLADGSASQFEYLKKSGCTSVDGVDDAHEFHQIRKFMKALGITEEEQEELFAALSGLLHLGNISFTPIPLKDGHKRSEDASTVDDKVHVSDVTMSNVESASQLLGVEVELLKNMLVTRTITVGTPGNAKMAKENTYTIQFTETEAVHARDALSKHIYSVFFDWIVSRINLNIDLNNLTQFIGILDISGFEIFEVNSFEQMCINFANEKIQQYFNVQILQQEQEIYLLEGLKWRKVEYQDNQEVINLVEGKRTGIFALLDEECIMPKGTDKSFTSKVHTNHTSNNNLAVPVAKGKMRLTKDEGFVIKHFAGEVTYTSKNFLDKNNDTLHNDLQTLLMSTKKIMLRSIFKPTADEDERADDRSSNKRFRSVSGRFQGQLTLLINELNSTTSHFIRCIKPNEVQKPQIFNNHSVMTQLRYNGMCTALELMQVGFPTRIAFDELYVRYSPFLPLAFANLKPIIFCEALLVALDLHGGKDFQMGLTKVFFKAGKLKFLDELTSTSKDDIDKVVGKVRKWLAAKRWRGAIFAVKSLNRLQKQVEGIRRVKKWRRLGRFMLRIVRIWKPLLQKCRKKLLTSEAYQKKVQEEAQRREELKHLFAVFQRATLFLLFYSVSMERRPAWLDSDGPQGYVAGMGRGATGFTTRSDIGPARSMMEAPPPMPRDDDDDRGDYSESNYDTFEGYGGSLVDPTAAYEQDDKEADDVWAAIDAKMDSKRKARREKKQKEEMEKYRASRPKIQDQFADAKKDLASVSDTEWYNIPEIGDQTKRFRKKVKTNLGFLPVPDSVLEKSKSEGEYLSSLDAKQAELGIATPMSDGLKTPYGGTATPDQKSLGEARTRMLDVMMKRMSDSVTGQTVVDPKGYLTGLSSVKVSTDAEIGDLKKAEKLLESVRKTNPKHGPAWIASARLAEVAGKIANARKLITQGCQTCPDSEDVWIEAARLHNPEDAKGILAKAVKQLSTSVKIWLQAAKLETDPKNQKKVLRKALETVPTSVMLWKAAIELENPDDAKLMLARAVECVPHSVEMWLALAHLETYENARKVLNKARTTIPTDPTIWITAAQLEESHGNLKVVGTIIKRAVASLAAHVALSRDQWLAEAEKSEQVGSVATCQALIQETIGIGIEDEDKKRVWMSDAESALAKGMVNTARAIYAVALKTFPAKKSLWLAVVDLEKSHGTPEKVAENLKLACESCPKAEILWLRAAKEKWNQGDVAGAREILSAAFAENGNSEEIWLAAVKLEQQNSEPQRARALLAKAREKTGSEKVWMKSALLERECGFPDQEKSLLDTALGMFPQFPKFWMMRGQLEERQLQVESAKNVYERGLKNCPHSIPLWICAARLEEMASPARARSLLEKARQKNPKNAELWFFNIQVEIRANNLKVAQAQMAKALQECPMAGNLWALAIEMETAPAGKKTRSVEALKRCDNDPHVIVSVARIFWGDRKSDKAKSWFERSIDQNPDLGDSWANYWKFCVEQNMSEEMQRIQRKVTENPPHHGYLWTQVSKVPANSKLTSFDVLKLVADQIPLPSQIA
eukprot:TRINITY_DN5376_c0_g1_i4.p1 TRINITY_DN5376_c0_g1~~TRINITY_DN5376_c0_g1_i4.p1  ORF type:complete len:1818 (+),score=627.39 TRINITY_DN5376_c0_g1_i4:113-5566(+)